MAVQEWLVELAWLGEGEEEEEEALVHKERGMEQNSNIPEVQVQRPEIGIRMDFVVVAVEEVAVVVAEVAVVELNMEVVVDRIRMVGKAKTPK